jgi:hypothetical protein
MPKNKKVTLTSIYEGQSYEIDLSDDSVSTRITLVEREANELSMILYDRTGQKFKDFIDKENTITVYYGNDLIFNGVLDIASPSHSESGDYYNIIGYSEDVKFGWGDTGNRVFLDRYGHEILSGYTDTVLSQNLSAQGKIKVVSSNAADTMTVTIMGLYSVFTKNETVTLNGTSEVTCSNDYDSILFVSVIVPPTGDITIKDTSDNVLGTIPAGFNVCSESDISDCLHINFKEGVGSIGYDKSGGANNATIEGSPSWVTGGGIDLDGSTQYAYVSDPFATNTVFSFGATITPEGGAGTLRAILSPSSGTFVHFQLNASNKIEAWVYGPSKMLTSTTTVTEGEEYDVAITWGEGVGKLYVNGTQEDITDYSATPPTAMYGSWYIGRGFSDGRYFNGKIKKVWAADDEKSATDISRLHYGELPNFGTGAVYTIGLRIAYSQDMDYQIESLPCYNEAPVTTMERVMDIGDSNGIWTGFYDSSLEIYRMYPKSTAGTQHQLGDHLPVSYDNRYPEANAIILKCAKVKQSDGQMQELLGYATTDNGYSTKIARAIDLSITEEADAEQKAQTVIEEYGTVEKLGAIDTILNIDLKPGDQIYLWDIRELNWSYERINRVYHFIDEQRTSLEVGDKIQSVRTIEFLTDLANVATYGMVGYQNLDDRKHDTIPIDRNIGDSYPLTVNFTIPSEGITKVYLEIEGAKYLQYSADDHYHDNAASYVFDDHTHPDGTLAGDSHGHSYGNMKDTSQAHGLSISWSGGYASTENHTHSVSGNTGYEEPDLPHRHSVSITTGSPSGYIPVMRSITNITTTDSASAALDSGSSGTTGVAVGGSTGSRGGSISGNSGSKTIGPAMAEDTYPNEVAISINGTDRTTALGGPWSDDFDLTGDNKLDITEWVNNDGRHTIAFTSSRNGRINGDILIYY